MSRGLVLFVEDNTDFRTLLTDGLTTLGFEVCAFPSGMGVLDALLNAQPPFVLLTDLYMPQMNGFELVAELRQLGLLDVVPLVVLTASMDQLPGVISLTKPVDLEKLARIFDRLLAGALGQKETAAVRIEMAAARRRKQQGA